MKRDESWSNSDHRARDSGRKTWRDWHETNPWLFPLPSELAKDPGPIGVTMRRIPGELLRDADRCTDSWADLCANRFIPRGFHGLFRGCASVLPAALSLVHTAYSRGDLIERAKRSMTETECEAVNRKLFAGMWRSGAGLLRDGAVQEGPEMLSQFEEYEARLLKMVAKQRGKAASSARSDRPTADRLRRKHPLRYLMVTNWLRCGCLGDPGFMFYSDNALADLFSVFDWRGFEVAADDLNSEQIEQMRGRLGLRKANEKLPLVTGVRMNHKTSVIELNTQDAKIARYEWPKPPFATPLPN
jgi:hypothetical protein